MGQPICALALCALALFVVVTASTSDLSSTDDRLPTVGRYADFGNKFYKVKRDILRNYYTFIGDTAQFHGFLQFNERPRPGKRNDLPFRFRHKCKSWPRKTRTFDGYCNNKRRPNIGSAGTTFKRLSKGTKNALNISDPTLPNPRVISNIISTDDNVVGNRRHMSELVTFFGQFLDHTITSTENDKTPIPIPVPANDTTFNGGVIPFFSTRKELTKRGLSPVNLLPSFIDAASIYGPSEERANKLRAFKNGLMRVGDNDVLPIDEQGFYLSGDKRANENPALTAMHTLFFREHNRVCGELTKAFPRWGDEKLYHIARKIVGAEIQAIVYYEFLPAVLGHCLEPYTGYNRRVDPRVSNEFSTVAYRVGHTLINQFITSIDGDGKKEQIELRDAFFSPKTFNKTGVDGLMRGMIAKEAAEVDVKVTSEVRNFLVGGAGDSLRLDLVALNVQRGRDHEVPHYNAMRKLYGLRPVKNFKQITSDPELSARLEKVYQDVDRVDAWIGGLAEDHVAGSSLGPMFKAAWEQEFTRLRDGDRLYYERSRMFPWRWVRKVKTIERLCTQYGGIMRQIILDNTDIDKKLVKRNPFKV